MKRELPKPNNFERTNGNHNALCYQFLTKHWIINLHNHMHFFRYLDDVTIASEVSFPLIVLIHVNCIVYKKKKNLILGYNLKSKKSIYITVLLFYIYSI